MINDETIDDLINEIDELITDPVWYNGSFGNVGYEIADPRLKKFSTGYIISGYTTLKSGLHPYLAVHDIHKNEVFDFGLDTEEKEPSNHLVLYNMNMHERDYYKIPSKLGFEEFFEHSLMHNVNITYELYSKIINFCENYCNNYIHNRT